MNNKKMINKLGKKVTQDIQVLQKGRLLDNSRIDAMTDVVTTSSMSPDDIASKGMSALIVSKAIKSVAKHTDDETVLSICNEFLDCLEDSASDGKKFVKKSVKRTDKAINNYNAVTDVVDKTLKNDISKSAKKTKAVKKVNRILGTTADDTTKKKTKKKTHKKYKGCGNPSSEKLLKGMTKIQQQN
jgi:hypothetical protein